ncbi:MAG: class I SAM-dependent methyltransferase [Actinomycetota bacterium]
MCAPATEHDAGFDHGRRGRLNAWFFTRFDRYINHVTRASKAAAFAGIEAGDIVELGPGVGANFDYLPSGSTVIAVEPNRAMHDHLRRRAAERDVTVELVTAPAATIPLPDASVDEVLCSLVLCTVDDQEAALAEVRRILRCGGRFRFVEHVAAPVWSPRRWLQHTLRRPWKWVYEGCDLCRDTAAAIETAGFGRVDLHHRRMRRSAFVPVNSTIHGVAVR